MSVFTISNRFLDPYDPFWICRTIALKVGTVTILLFLCNAFITTSSSAVVFMMTTIVGTAVSEILPTHSRLKKIVSLITIVLLLSSTGALFGLFSYFETGLFIFVMLFTYLVLRLMAQSAKTAALPIMMVTWGVMQLGGGATTDLASVLNNYFYYFQFAFMGILTVIFFPNFTPNIYKSALIRILETDVQHLGQQNFKNSDSMVLSALMIMRTKLPLLPESYKFLYESVVQFQHAWLKSKQVTADEQVLVKSVLIGLIQSVSHQTPFLDKERALSQLQALNPAAHVTLSNLVKGYDQCLA